MTLGQLRKWGIKMSDNSFEKFDDDKIQPSLITPSYIKGTAKVLTLGAKKYSKDNWQKCDDRSRYEDALLRHILAYQSGEKCDPETGLSHLYHASCNLMFLDHFDMKGK